MRRCLPLGLLLLSGCSPGIADLKCFDVANEAIRISDGILLSINNQAETSRSAKRLTCHGTGFLKDGEERPVRFEALTSDDGDTLFKYDDDEHQATLTAKQERETRLEEAQFEMAIQRTVEAATSEGSGASQPIATQ